MWKLFLTVELLSFIGIIGATTWDMSTWHDTYYSDDGWTYYYTCNRRVRWWRNIIYGISCCLMIGGLLLVIWF